MIKDETTILEYYTSSDLGCCASLLALNFKLVSIERSNPRRALFCFEKSPELELAVADYWNDKLLVNARDLIDSIKKLKSRIYGE